MATMQSQIITQLVGLLITIGWVGCQAMFNDRPHVGGVICKTDFPSITISVLAHPRFRHRVIQ